MTQRYVHALNEGQIGNVSLRNRIYFAPHGHPTWLLAKDRAPDDDFIAYMTARAAGGVGLLFHSLPVLPNVQFGRHCPYESRTVPAFAKLASAVHEHGSHIFAQLSVFVREPRWGARTPPAPALAPSALPRPDGRSSSREATSADIEHIVEAFETCARNLALAGYDGVELHAAHGLFVAQFLSPYFNHRTDDFGGSAENRARLVEMLLLAIRRGIGPSGAVGVRLNCDEMLEGGFRSADAKGLLSHLETMSLLDFADLDLAVEPQQMDLAMPTYLSREVPYASHVSAVRSALDHTPVLSTLGRVRDLATADAALAAGVVDFVGIARGLIAEPDLVNNAVQSQERRSRRCIGANHCVAGTQEGVWGCAINPRTGREGDRLGPIGAPPISKRVVVVGGGPAGMEAARSAAVLGHQVTLIEGEAELGGQLRLWARLPGRWQLGDGVRWWADEIRRLGVSLLMGTPASRVLVEALAPNVVVVATGAEYVRDPRIVRIPGADLPHVLTPEEVLGARLGFRGKRVVVVDDEGTNVGIGISETLARGEAQVDFVTRFERPAEHQTSTWETLTIVPRACAAGVTVRPHLLTRAIVVGGLQVVDLWTGEESRIEGVDHVVLVVARASRGTTGIAADLAARQVFTVGDAFSPRGLREATFEGHRAALQVGDRGVTTSVQDFWASVERR